MDLHDLSCLLLTEPYTGTYTIPRAFIIVLNEGPLRNLHDHSCLHLMKPYTWTYTRPRALLTARHEALFSGLTRSLVLALKEALYGDLHELSCFLHCT